ncbi:VanZ family protein [Peribacillus huizhouensis]|uniref:VanZ family protein n=1 Tax=Peribacillus huizhouensis TaxID=1501239 RepID=A0ABR6CKQ3_9BACI|nr:VanZ family protein [Peribacillus huizhouensis]MBA9025636.1 VanZ family protein [Peribacillus huizhouensis]
MNQKRILFASLLLWASCIFYFSSQPYEKQNLQPFLGKYLEGHTSLENMLTWVVFSYGGHEVSVQSQGLAGFLEFFIRKAAHLSIFFVFGFLVVAALRYFSKRCVFSFSVPVMCVFFYACLDEIHQHFTGGRTPLWQDVIIDTIGGLLGILFFHGLLRSKKISTVKHWFWFK